jgi:hypothetical protein
MPALTRASNGTWKARKCIPDDVRSEYKRLYGQGHEAKLTVPAVASASEAKRRYCEWLSEHEREVTAIRAALRGDGVDLTNKEALALAGEWYRWSVARHEEARGDPERWEGALDSPLGEIRQHLPTDLARRANEDTEHELGSGRDHLTCSKSCGPMYVFSRARGSAIIGGYRSSFKELTPQFTEGRTFSGKCEAS